MSNVRLAPPIARDAAPPGREVQPAPAPAPAPAHAPETAPEARNATPRRAPASRVFLDDCGCLFFVARLLQWATRNSR